MSSLTEDKPAMIYKPCRNADCVYFAVWNYRDGYQGNTAALDVDIIVCLTCELRVDANHHVKKEKA